MLKLATLPTDARPRIVKLLKDLLEKAERGEVAQIWCLYDEGGTENHDVVRDGFTDKDLVWALEIAKARVLGHYK